MFYPYALKKNLAWCYLQTHDFEGWKSGRRVQKPPTVKSNKMARAQIQNNGVHAQLCKLCFLLDETPDLERNSEKEEDVEDQQDCSLFIFPL